MLHIKKLNLDEIREIYNAYMHEAFPPSELRPFASMEMLYNKNCYPCYGFYDETDSLCAYAYFSCTENGKYALLDYFAVKKDLRGTKWKALRAPKPKKKSTSVAAASRFMSAAGAK